LSNVVSAPSRGVQMTGIFNYCSQSFNGVQIAGVTNYTKSIKGLQISTIGNHADSVRGLQFSGFANHSIINKGMQLSVFLNKTKINDGVQIGLFNYADSSNGVAIGIFNYIKNGYHKLEVSADELYFATVGIRSGLEKFHSIFLLGVNYSKPGFLTYGYGLGSTLPLKKLWFFNMDLTLQQFQYSKFSHDIDRIQLFRIFTSLEYKCHPKLRIGIGPTLNLFVNDRNKPVYFPSFHDLASNSSLPLSGKLSNKQIWIGGKLYLKFF